MKKILVLIASMLLALVLAAPANASWGSPWDYFQQVDCGSAPMTGHLSINRGTGDNSDQLYVEGDINDAGSGAPHGWSWDFYHNGDRSYSGSNSGSFTRDKLMVNYPGSPEVVKFVAVANNGAKCSQSITVYG